jgi:ubiquinone/menaquinone biosynthesis C-methylase UbiE
LLLHCGFEALYRWGPPIYDPLTDVISAGSWHRWQQVALTFIPAASTAVELGCGTGRLAAFAVSCGYQWIGVDRSLAMIRQARKRERAHGPRFLCADARRLPLRTASADAVVATFPSPYILMPETAREIRRVLRPGGRVVVVLTAHVAPVDLRRRLLACVARLVLGRSRTEAPLLSIPQLSGQVHRLATSGGWVDLYVAQVDPIA